MSRSFGGLGVTLPQGAHPVLRHGVSDRDPKLDKSAIHYIETAKNGNHEQRARLGQAMYELSGGYTLASYRLLLTHEIEVSLYRRVPGIVPRPYDYLSKGISHAFEHEVSQFELSEDVRSQVSEWMASVLTASGQRAIEKAW